MSKKIAHNLRKLILESVMVYNPDIVITESTIGKYSIFTDSKFAHLLLYQLNCPVIVVRDSTMPLVSFVTHLMMKITGNIRSCSSSAFNEKQGKIDFKNRLLRIKAQ